MNYDLLTVAAAAVAEGDAKADDLLAEAQSEASNEALCTSLKTLSVMAAAAAIVLILFATTAMSEPSAVPTEAEQSTGSWLGWTAAAMSSTAAGLAGMAYTLFAAPAQQEGLQQQKDLGEDSVVQPTKRQLNRNKTRLRHRKGLMRSKLAREKREEEERTKTTVQTVVTEEHRLNEMTRGRQHSRISQCRGATRYAGGCRRKIHRQQHMVKRRPEEAGPLISALMVVLSVVQSGDSWIEATVALGALCAITLSATTMVMCTVGALLTGRSSATYATLARLRRMGCSCRSMLHIIPSTALCWTGRLVSAGGTCNDLT